VRIDTSACLKTKAICASVNFDAFMKASSSQPRDHKWKIPASNGPKSRGHVSHGRCMNVPPPRNPALPLNRLPADFITKNYITPSR
jgi:hypothetical protein